MQQPDHTSLLTLAEHQPNLLWPATNQILKETGSAIVESSRTMYMAVIGSNFDVSSPAVSSKLI